MESIEELWVEHFGDLRQELVFIGQNLDKTGMIDALNDCLVSEEDLERGEDFWESLSDTFPPWSEIQ